LSGACLWAATAWLSPVRAQGNANTVPARIVTVDGVELSGTFYPSPKKNAPTVLLLHPIGDGKSTKLDGWDALANTLQKSGFTVMMFDFRGHGDSTTIKNLTEFTKYPINRAVKLDPKNPTQIEVKNYIKNSDTYLPVLVNDIAAVKAYLDRQHDNKDCNTGTTIVIGAEDGATLGAIWINSEMIRYKAGKINPFNGMPLNLEPRPEGSCVAAAVFLGIKPEIGKRKISLANVLGRAVHGQTPPMQCVFFYGEKDTPGKTFNTKLIKDLKAKAGKKLDDRILPGEVGNTKLAGVKLLAKDLKTDDAIAKYLADAIVPVEWEGRDFSTSTYVWKNGIAPTQWERLKMIPVGKDEKNFKFDTYTRFAQ
jgi:hypothetical protein